MKRIFILFILKISQFSRDPNFLKSSQTILSRKRHPPYNLFRDKREGNILLEELNFVLHKSSFETFKCSIITIPTILVNTLSYRPSTDRLHPCQDSRFPCLVRILIPTMWIVDSKESSKLVKSYLIIEERRKRERKERKEEIKKILQNY